MPPARYANEPSAVSYHARSPRAPAGSRSAQAISCGFDQQMAQDLSRRRARERFAELEDARDLVRRQPLPREAAQLVGAGGMIRIGGGDDGLEARDRFAQSQRHDDAGADGG